MHRFLNLLWLAKFIKTVTRDNDFILYQIAITKLLAQKNTKQKLFTKATSIEFVNGARWTDNYYRICIKRDLDWLMVSPNTRLTIVTNNLKYETQ